MSTVSHPERLKTEHLSGTPSIFADATRAARNALRQLPAHERIRAVSSILDTFASEMAGSPGAAAPTPVRVPAVSRDGLTARQAEVVTVIEEHIAKKGRPPTIREIGTAMGIRSTNGVQDHLNALKRKGVIDYEPFTSRSMRLLTATCVTCGMPCADEQWVVGGGEYACSLGCIP